MNVILGVIRTKTSTSTRPINKSLSTAFDILLIDIPYKDSEGHINNQKGLLSTVVTREQDASDSVLEHLHNVTGSGQGGLKGLRAVYVAPQYIPSLTEPYLYVVPIDQKDKLNPAFVDHARTSPRFFSLDSVIVAANNGTMLFSKQTIIVLNRLDSWLKKLSSPSLEQLFKKSSAENIETPFVNPALIVQTENLQQSSSSTTSIQEANKVLTNMLGNNDKVDKVVINPLFGSGLPYKHSVDAIAVNQFWSRGPPSQEPSPLRTPSSGSISDSSLQDEYKIFKLAWEGNAQGIQEMLKQNVSVNQRDQNTWAPLHYAVWYGHLEVIQVLVTEGNGNPNITNKKRSTPLHFAALSAQPYVVELLLSHPEIDVMAVDREGRTALNMCENKTSDGHKACTDLLKKAADKPFKKIEVHLMDGTSKQLDLVSGPNTTVHQLHIQMLRVLKIPDQYMNLFTIWISSKNLQLQLKKEHRPVEHMLNWNNIVHSLTEFNPSKEEARLEWRRDARLTINVEKTVRNAMTIALLFNEACANYMKSLYPCSDDDAVILGALLHQINHGCYDAKKSKQVLIRKQLAEIMPPSKLDTKLANWSQKIQAKYKQLSEQTQNKESTTFVLQYQFLLVCWNLVVYGSAFFSGSVVVKSANKPTPVQIGVNDVGVHVVHNSNKTMLQTFHYKDIDWQFDDDNCQVEIKPKGATAVRVGSIILKTKQAGLIDHLMTKMSNSSSNTPLQ